MQGIWFNDVKRKLHQSKRLVFISAQYNKRSKQIIHSTTTQQTQYYDMYMNATAVSRKHKSDTATDF